MFAAYGHSKVLLQRPGQSSKSVPWLGLETKALPQLSRFSILQEGTIPTAEQSHCTCAGEGAIRLQSCSSCLRTWEKKFALWALAETYKRVSEEKGGKIHFAQLWFIFASCFYKQGSWSFFTKPYSSDFNILLLIRTELWLHISEKWHNHYRKVFYCLCTSFLIVHDELPDIKWHIKGTDKIFSYKSNSLFCKMFTFLRK